MKRVLIILPFLLCSLSAEITQSGGSYIKEKREVQKLKKDLNDFYKQKEDEYKKRQKELDELLRKIEKEKREIEELYKKNQETLANIRGEMASKTTKMYSIMKEKKAAEIFTNMIKNGQIDNVFDIIIKLKEKKAIKIMKYMDSMDTTLLLEMIQEQQKNTDKN